MVPILGMKFEDHEQMKIMLADYAVARAEQTTRTNRTGPTTFGPVLGLGFLANSVLGLVRSGPQTDYLALLQFRLSEILTRLQ
jgi:choline dehydrogenase-like flavoprotein